MTNIPMRGAPRETARLLSEGVLHTLPDDRLLDRYCDDGDERAFAVLVARHGAMVLKTCVAVLHDPNDAEDAFQTTFLTLIRRAGTIRGRDRLGGWLRRVAHRASVRIDADRRRRRERREAEFLIPHDRRSAGDDVERSERIRSIDAEIARLPEHYRRAVTLCLIEGASQPEAAGKLGLSEGAVRGRLARARALLRDRLTRRGVRSDESRQALPTSVPAGWIASLLATARTLDVARSARPGWAGVLTRAGAVVFSVAGGLALLTTMRPSPPSDSIAPPPVISLSAAVPAPLPFEEPKTTVDDPEAVVVLHGRVLDPDGGPVVGARLWLATNIWAVAQERATSSDDGSYRITVPTSEFRRRSFGDWNAETGVQAALVATAEGFGAAWSLLARSTPAPNATMLPEYVADLQLVPDQPIEGRILDADSRPVAGVDVTVARIRAPVNGEWTRLLDDLRRTPWNPVLHEQPPPVWNSFLDELGWQRRPPLLDTPRFLQLWNEPLHTVSDAEGRFHLAGVGRDRLIVLSLSGPGVQSNLAVVGTVDDFAEIARSIRQARPPDHQQPRRLFDAAPEIQVERAHTIAGVVRDARTGEPLPAIRVTGLDSSSFTDAHGRYRLATKNSSIRAESDDPERRLSAVRAVPDGARKDGESTLDLELEPGVRIEGRVLEAGTDRPIAWSRIAGYVEYRPLATNHHVQDPSTTGPAFANANLLPVVGIGLLTSRIEDDGRFRMAVPPGHGVLLIQLGAGLAVKDDLLEPGEDLLRHFRYAPLNGRTKGDGAPGDDPRSFPGIGGSIPFPVDRYHAYRVIDPPTDAESLSVEFEIPRAPSLALRFVDPDGRPVPGVTVAGLLPGIKPMIALEGSEAEATGLDPSRQRSLVAVSRDGRWIAQTVLDAEEASPRTIVMSPSSTVTGRLVNDDDEPIAGFLPRLAYASEAMPTMDIMGNASARSPVPRSAEPLNQTDAEGRFRIEGLLPDLLLDIVFQWAAPQAADGRFRPGQPLRPRQTQRITLRPGEARDVGEIRISTKRPE